MKAPIDLPSPHGRIFQGRQFETDLVAGRTLLELVSVQWAEPTRSGLLAPDVLLMRVEEGQWHRIFFDAGLVFWEVWGDEEVAEDLDGASQDDLADRFRLRGRKLDVCLAFPELPNGASGLHIHLTDGQKLVLAPSPSPSPSDAADIDAVAELRLIRGTVQDTYRERIRGLP